MALGGVLPNTPAVNVAVILVATAFVWVVAETVGVTDLIRGV